MEHVYTQRVDNWVVTFETGSLKSSPTSEECLNTSHPSVKPCLSASLTADRGAPPLRPWEEEEEDSTMATGGEAHFSSEGTLETMELSNKQNGLLVQ
jgi:hypothetical protein